MTGGQIDLLDSPLSAVVFCLAYDDAFRSSEKFMGGVGHSLGLAMIESINAPLSEELHNFNGISPFTSTGLFQVDSHRHWLRLTALRPDIVEVIKTLTEKMPFLIINHKKKAYDGWTAEAILNPHDWIEQTTPRQLISEYWHPIRDVTLQFKTGTAINSIGLHRSLPEPHLIFKNLWERWQRLTPAALPCPVDSDLFNVFIHDMMNVSDFQLSAETIFMENSSFPTFKGTVTYRVHKHNEALEKRDRDLYKHLKKEQHNLSSLINVLAHYSFYSGVGIKTARGMGMVRPIDEEK